MILVSWIGGNDLQAILGGEAKGPIHETLRSTLCDELHLLYNYDQSKVEPYLEWLMSQFEIKITSQYVFLSSPTNFSEIYNAVDPFLGEIVKRRTHTSILLSPGTPAMQAIWILLGRTKYDVDFYQSSIESGVQKVEIPFDISAEFLPSFISKPSNELSQLSEYHAPINAAFDDIITQNPEMEDLKHRATVLAERDIPVLIYGESGTGKELFATAIHNASQRSSKPLITVNCGAIPSELIDSILFGHVKGSFTGANVDKKGVFEAADGGTLFLDEFGELPLEAQVRLLRVLQSGEIIPVGASHSRNVDVRIITATNRNLMNEVSEGKFREDLFYRVAVGVLHLPPLRERKGDILLLVKSILDQITTKQNIEGKKISVKAKNIIIKHDWPGNVRELHSTLLRAALWSKKSVLSECDITSSLFERPSKKDFSTLVEFGEGFSIQSVIDDFAATYIKKALVISGDQKTKAAKILGLSSYQTLDNWMKKYGIK